jgi:hypothetical protein
MINRITKYILISVILSISGCLYSVEERIYALEKELNDFVEQKKKVRDVINKYGQPTKYVNNPDVLGQSGTYMVYDYKSQGHNCVIMLKFAPETLVIIDWDYEGNCLDINIGYRIF